MTWYDTQISLINVMRSMKQEDYILYKYSDTALYFRFLGAEKHVTACNLPPFAKKTVWGNKRSEKYIRE